MRRSPGSWALVAAQFILLAAIGLSAPWSALNAMQVIVLVCGLMLVGWAYRAMGTGTFSVFPEPRPSASLILRGPYRWVRHPMYLAVLLCAAAVGSAAPLGLHTGCALLLVPVILIKVRVEERKLDAAFPDRPARMKDVARLLPGVW